MEKINEKELAKIFNGIKHNNEQSFNDFCKLYYNLIYNIAFSVTKNKQNSEDVTQTVFEKLYKMPKQKLPQKYEASWLYTVTKNEALQFIRKEKSNIELDSIYEIQQNDKNIDLIIDTDYYNSLMKKLKQKEKEIVTLKIVSDLTFSEIAKILNMPIATVQWNYYKSINVLKISLGTLATVLLTFTIGLTKIIKQNNKSKEKIVNEQIQTEHSTQSTESKENNDSDIMESNNSNITDNKTAQVVYNNENEEQNWQSYTLFSISILILITGFILINKVKNKIYKKN